MSDSDNSSLDESIDDEEYNAGYINAVGYVFEPEYTEEQLAELALVQQDAGNMADDVAFMTLHL
jgi:hypothetical protein